MTSPKLDPDHVEYLAARGVSVEVAETVGLRSVSPQEGMAVLGRSQPLPSRAIDIPYPLVDPEYHRLRVFAGDVRFFAPAKREVPIYVPPIGPTDGPIVIVEGPIKAIALSAHGIRAVGLGGVSTTLEPGGSSLNASWSTLPIGGADVRVLFDANRLSNLMVAMAEARLAAALERARASVSIALLPTDEQGHGWGPDDFLVAHGIGQLEAVLDAAVPAAPEERAALADTNADDAHACLTLLLADMPFMASLLVRGPASIATARQHFALHHLAGDFRQAIKRLEKALEADRRRSSEKPKANTSRLPIKGEVVEDDCRYCIETRAGLLSISSFVLRPKARVICDDREYLEVDAVNEGGAVAKGMRIPKRAFDSKASFLAELRSPDLQWTGSDANVQRVLGLLAEQQVPTRVGTHNFGYLEHEGERVWIGPELTITADGPVVQADLEFIPRPGHALLDRIAYRPTPVDQVKRTARTALPLLLQLNSPRVMLPIIGWFFATPYRPQLVVLIGHFAILMIWGTRGCGKTTLIRELLRFFGFIDTRPYSVTDTPFAMMSLLSSSNSIPIALDEFKQSDMPSKSVELLFRNLRRAYGGEDSRRGRSDLSVQSFDVSAAVCLAGESKPSGDAALLERLLCTSVDRAEVDTIPRQNALRELQALKVEDLVVPYIQFALAQDVPLVLKRARDLTDRVLAKVHPAPIPLRTKDNLIVMMFGLLMFEGFALEMEAQLPELDVDAAVLGCIQEVVEQSGSVKDGVDVFLEVLAVAAYTGDVQDGLHFVWVEGALCLYLPACFEAFQRARARMQETDATNGLTALKRLLTENMNRGGYVVAMDKRVKLNGITPRTVAIDVSRVPDSIDIDGFRGTNRSHGGARPRRDLHN